MTTATEKTRVIGVVNAGRSGVTVNVNGTRTHVSWEKLREAAKQNDPGLRAIYADLLTEAQRLAKLERTIEVRIVNRANVDTCYAAELYDVAGEFVSGRLIAADFGLQDTYDYARRDAEEAAETLRARGYEVVRGW